MDKGIIDGILAPGCPHCLYGIGQLRQSVLKKRVIGDGVDWVKDQFLAMTKEFRQLQTG